MDRFISFLEKNLGKIQCGYSEDENDTKLSFQIVKYKQSSLNKLVHFSTLGLSNYLIDCEDCMEEIRYEIAFDSRESFGDINIPSVLEQIGKLILNRGLPILSGEVMGPWGEMFYGTSIEGVCFKKFLEYSEEDNCIKIMTAIPLTANEILFLKEKGSEEFDRVAKKLKIDFTDFYRKS